MQSPGPGIHAGVAADIYHSWEAVNSSLLKIFAQKSAAHAQQYLIHPSAETAAQQLGQAAHVAVLEPHRFDDLYVCGIPGDRRTKEIREAWAALEDHHKGKTILAPGDFAFAGAVRAACNAHESAGRILRATGPCELSITWELDTQACKSRIDKYALVPGIGPVIADLKTCQDASPEGFRRAAWNFRYDIQAAFYLDAVAWHGGERERLFVWIAIEKSPPHAVACYTPDAQMLARGRADYRAAMRALSTCRASGHWPGYDPGIKALYVPAWAGKTIDTEEEILF